MARRNRRERSPSAFPAPSAPPATPEVGGSALGPRAVFGVLLVVLAAGALLRAAYLAELPRDPLFVKPALDAELHDYWARSLASGHWDVPPNRTDPRIPSTPYFRPPGYPYALSIVYRLTGGAPIPSRAIQLALGLVSACLGFLLGRRYGGAATGLVTAALMATSWNLIFFEGELLDACLLAGLTPGTLLLLLRAADSMKRAPAFVAGASTGILALVRPNALVFVPAAALWLFWTARRRRAAAAPRVAILLAGALLAIAPATLRNHAVSGEWVLISANGGINLYIGNNAKADGLHAGIPDVETLTAREGWTCFDYPLVVAGLGRRLGHPVGYAEASRYWSGEARRWIAAHPGRFISLTLRRAALLLGPREGGDRDVDLTRAASPLLSRIPGGFPVFLGLALTGLAWLGLELLRDPAGAPTPPGAGDRLETAVLLVAFLATYAASFLPFFFNSRYRVPILVILFVFAADALVRWGRLLRQHRFRAALGASLVAAALSLAASVDLSGYRPDPSAWHAQRANAWRDAGRTDRAVEEYREAIRLDPTAVAPRRDLALILRDSGRAGEASTLLQDALAADPHAIEARFDLAQMLASQGRFEEAVREYRTVLSEAPHHANARLSLGTALLQLGRAEEATEAYRQALADAPGDPLVLFVVGRAALARGSTEEGVGLLRRALEIDPTFEPARRALSQAAGASGSPPGTALRRP